MTKIKYFYLIMFAFLLSVQTLAEVSKVPSKAVLKKAIENNDRLSKAQSGQKSSAGNFVKPYAEYHEAGYLLFNDTFDFNSRQAKLTMAEQLPKDVTLIIYTSSKSKSYHKRLLAEFESRIEPERIRLIHLPSGSRGFWARDGIPLPSIGFDANFYLTDARYYHNFEPDTVLKQYFDANLLSHQYYFEGGNFMATDLGDCIIIDNDLAIKMPNSLFETHYGCLNLIRLPHLKGIGHVDESIKFIDGTNVLTDEPRYRKTLEDAGFIVHLLPRPSNHYENYTNALLINGTVFVPVFGQKNDQKALNIYRKFGLKVVPINTSTLSNQGLGSLHCITMSYPKVKFNYLVGLLNAKVIPSISK